jgi:UDP-N-acetylglucosamine 2-epimerase (non-hydrolysing)
MIDTLIRLLPETERSNGLPKRFVLVTLHRPSNVDNSDVLKSIIRALMQVSDELPIIFPVHPRTRQRIAQFGLDVKGVQVCDPVGYLEFLALQRRATVVITDSGGIQEETTYLGVPCLTMRENTERPITVAVGTNTLVGSDMNRLQAELFNILNGRGKKGAVPPLWDGHASERIAEIVARS